MEYKQFQRHHNAMQSGRGREMEGRLKKKCRENGQMKGTENKDADIQGRSVRGGC